MNKLINVKLFSGIYPEHRVEVASGYLDGENVLDASIYVENCRQGGKMIKLYKDGSIISIIDPSLVDYSEYTSDGSYLRTNDDVEHSKVEVTLYWNAEYGADKRDVVHQGLLGGGLDNAYDELIRCINNRVPIRLQKDNMLTMVDSHSFKYIELNAVK